MTRTLRGVAVVRRPVVAGHRRAGLWVRCEWCLQAPGWGVPTTASSTHVGPFADSAAAAAQGRALWAQLGRGGG